MEEREGVLRGAFSVPFEVTGVSMACYFVAIILLHAGLIIVVSKQANCLKMIVFCGDF